MTETSSRIPEGLAAARKQIPTLFPYLRRYRNGLAVGVLCVAMTAGLATVVPAFVSETVRYITQESNTIEERGSVLVVEAMLARATHTSHLLPLFWDLQSGWVDRLALAPKKDDNRLWIYFCGILGFALLSGVFRFFQRWILIGISRKIEYDLRNDLFEHLLKMPPSFFDKMTTGDIIARATNDLNQVRGMLGPGLMYPVNSLLMMAFAIGWMVYHSPMLTLVAVFPPLIMAVGANRIAKVLHDRFVKVQEQYSRISTKVQENLTGIRVVKAYTREEAEVAQIEELNLDYLKKNIKYFKTMGVLYPFFTFGHNLGRLVVLTFGCYLMLTPGSGFDEGDFAAFLLYLNMLHFPMISIGWVLNIIQRGAASMARINEILDTQAEISDPEDPVEPESVEGRLTFRNVGFAYANGKPVLHNIDLEIEPGTILGVVGATGSGKSSITHLIPRFYDPTEGEILLDGVPLKRYRLETLRRSIGLVAQDHFMFSSSVAKNVGFGLDRESVFEETVQEASEIAAFHDNVLEFPKGYETLVGERGVTLSGGQRQRASIARALAIDPRILILDDALSAVDTQTEDRILSGLRKVMKERTTLLISHRISTVRDADRIVVLENGEIVEQGTHDELVALEGRYATLHRHQLLEEEIEGLSA